MTKINKEGWEVKKLGEVCEPKKNILRASSMFEAEDKIEYIDISSVDNSSSILTETTSYLFSEAPSRAQQVVIKDDIIVSLVRPNLKNVAMVNKDDDNLVASSGFCVVRAKDFATHKYLYYLCISTPFTKYLCNRVSGANYPAVRESDIREYPIPLPPLPLQHRIVEELDEINAIISAKKQQLSKLDELAQSIFYTMFGDPVANEKGWEVKTIGEVCHLKSGDSKANNSPEGTLPYVKVGDMNLPGNEEYITCSSKYVDYESNKKAIFPIGTVIFPKRGGAILTNKKRLTKVEVCCDLNTMGVIPSEALLSKYLYVWFKLLDLGTVCSGSTILQLNNCDIAPLKIQLPPLPLQQTFAARVSAIEDEKAAIAASIEKMQTLLDARMQEYFG